MMASQSTGLEKTVFAASHNDNSNQRFKSDDVATLETVFQRHNKQTIGIFPK